MKTLITIAAIFGITLASALPASAAIVRYNFELRSPAHVVLGGGTYSFNDQGGVANMFGETEYALTGFSFTLGGSSFGMGDLDGGTGLVLFGAGNLLLGLEAYRSTANPFSFLPAGPGSEDFFVNGVGASAHTLDVDAAVAASAPGSLWLAAAGLLPLAAALRARRRRGG